MDMEKTRLYEEETQRFHTLIVIDCRCVPRVYQLTRDMSFGRIYDGRLCDITAQSSITGRRHGEFLVQADGTVAYVDLNSLNGTYINGRKLKPYDENGSYPYQLHNGDVLRVDGKNADRPHNEAVIMIYRTDADFDENFKLFDCGRLVNITVGTDRNCVIRLKDPLVKKSHAVLRHSNGNWSVFSNSGETTVNGVKIGESAKIFPHDVLRFGNTLMVLYGNILIYNAPRA